VAHVCRKSCSRIAGNPACRLARERTRELFGVQRPAVGSARYEAVISESGAHQHSLGQLATAMLPQCSNGLGVDCDGTRPRDVFGDLN
jgi:hypothetical protein